LLLIPEVLRRKSENGIFASGYRFWKKEEAYEAFVDIKIVEKN
jgi:hypothetical protein